MTSSQPSTSATFVASCDIGPAEGRRFAVKDCLDVMGMPSRCGSPAFEHAGPAARHAPAVAALLAAGWRLTGKTNMHELAYGMTGINAHTGTPINPQWPELIPGGSSSGAAAAVAGGQVELAIGTDTGGSIRLPAACCGVIGLKPSFGLISRAGATPADSSLDCVGPLARDMATIEAAMVAMAPNFTPQVLARAPRLARIKAEATPEVREALLYPLQATGLALPEVVIPSLDAGFAAGMTLISAECYRAFGHLLREGRPLGADVAARLQTAATITPEEIAAAETVRAQLTEEIDAALEDVDALLLPALPSVPPTLDAAQDPKTVLPLSRFLRPFNLSGHPAIVLPQPTAQGRPAALQVIGRKDDDATLCAIARWLIETLPRA